MESNQDQALMRGPPDHRANGPDIPLSGDVVSFSTVRTCALARVEGSVPPTSGFGIRRSPLSYTRILFERVRICTSQRGSIGRVYLTTRPPRTSTECVPLPVSVYLFRHRSMVPPPASCGEERHIFDYLIQVLIRIINAKFQVIPIKSFLSRALKAK